MLEYRLLNMPHGITYISTKYQFDIQSGRLLGGEDARWRFVWCVADTISGEAP